ncbi:MAG TPA: hypothetical protein PLM24_08510 [Methanothrix sp.]|nr:hypothetical protein [Methanothrix sp.]HPR67158.1 hypothetical protein [Methanothrix sp.]
MSHGIFGFQRALACALHVQEELTVWKTIFESIGQNQCQSSLAHPAQAAQTCDGRTLAEYLKKGFDFVLTACEVRRLKRDFLRNWQSRG